MHTQKLNLKFIVKLNALRKFNMKTFPIGIFVFFAFVCFVSTQELEECVCWDSWVFWRIGRRQSGDQFLFRDRKLSNWTIPFDHILEFSYSNTNITQWQISMNPVRITFSNRFK